MKINPLATFVGVLFLIIATTGCSMIEDAGEVTAEVRAPSTLLLHNTTSRTVSYFVGDEDVMARIEFVVDVSQWPTIESGKIAEVPFEEIEFYSEETRRLWIRWTSPGSEGNTIRVNIE